MIANYEIEEWDEIHPRWHEFVACLEMVAPDQAPFVLDEYYRAQQSHLLVALQSNEVVGFLRFAVHWHGSNSDELLNPLWSMLNALIGILSPSSIVAIVSDKKQKVAHESYQRVEQFQIGKRRVVILKPI